MGLACTDSCVITDQFGAPHMYVKARSTHYERGRACLSKKPEVSLGLTDAARTGVQFRAGTWNDNCASLHQRYLN